ncbi:hypothetical protein TWF225_007778 [Orbilia oligospora]|uniref:Thiamine-binding protein domain-containing protein n=1 Tax=Orbilia oligospora TaxID=2813651 RepID=A0A8H2HL90_ORBOL|nr:hypothetical protein TWF225_007778 [Orbilia oligospora]KAF3235842.1 hypothetical protein TWF217_002855 [Orbilia oligospora]KAF3242091.1 hypothetical protein TWF128_010571 [Orbilia oligospora]TGJ65655.1 hypothetical protein EYR41_009607 [Orbilia oligospora]
MTVLLSPLALSIPSLVTSFQIFTQSPRGSAESYFIVNRLFGFSNDPKFLSPKRNCPPNSFIFLFYFILFFYLLNFLTHPTSRHQLQLRVGLQVQCSRCIKCSSSLRSSTVFRSPHFESITSTMAAHAENVTFRQCAHLATPDHVTADFCLIPIGTPTASVSQHIANIQKMIAASGIKYSMHSAGTTLEGSWEEVTKVMGQAHTLLHNQGVVRIQTDIRIGSRTDKVQSIEDKVSKVEQILKADAAANPATEG